ncbi:MAG: tryptophan--tRNA ligase [bacterium]
MTKRILTGIKPTGTIHIGNYFGAIAPMLRAQAANDAEVYLFLANLHAFTALHNPQEIREHSYTALKTYIACGIDPKKTCIYTPADIPAHTELGRILGCITNMGTMERMHAYKDAVAKGKANEISVGVFSYPILMAADILLYDATNVPVGKDQKQHVEYARDIAEKFNRTFGETFVLPEPTIDASVATVPGIDGRKMSKSYNNHITLLDDEKTLLKKIKLISTDTKSVEEPKDPDTCNVYNITKLFLTEEENNVLRKRYTDGGLGYKEAKDILFEKLRAFLQPIQTRFNEITDADIQAILKAGSEKVKPIADKKIQEVKEKIGFIL